MVATALLAVTGTAATVQVRIVRYTGCSFSEGSYPAPAEGARDRAGDPGHLVGLDH